MSSPAAAATAQARFLGVLMLDTRFPRPLGDIGHPDSFGVPTRQVVLKGAWPEKVVASATSLRRERLVEPFQRMVRQLVADGAAAITTSCGFLVLLQADLQRAAGRVPVVTSSLLLLPGLLRQHAQVGVLTISASALGKEHLRAAGVPQERLKDVLVQGVPRDTEFANAILGNRDSMDLALAEADVVAAAHALKARAPNLTHLVLECTNMPPYAAAITAATGLQTWSLLQSTRVLEAFRP
jgi:hypothetical protein